MAKSRNLRNSRGGEEDSSLQTAVCLIERSELWMEEDWRSDGVQRSETEAE